VNQISQPLVGCSTSGIRVHSCPFGAPREAWRL